MNFTFKSVAKSANHTHQMNTSRDTHVEYLNVIGNVRRLIPGTVLTFVGRYKYTCTNTMRYIFVRL